MVDVAKIKQEFAGLVGWRSPYQSSIPALPTTLTNSSSGLYFNELSDLISAEVADIIRPMDAFSNEALTVTQYLQRLTDESITSLVNLYLLRLSRYNKMLLSDQQLFTLDTDYPRSYNKEPGITGITIRPVGYRCLTIRIYKIQLQFEQAQTIRIYVFGQDKRLISYTDHVYSTPGLVQDFALNLNLPLKEQYSIGYREENVQGNPVCFDILDSSAAYCYIWSYREPNEYTLTQSRGLNIEYSLYCDLTDIVVRNKYLFTRALQLSVGIRFMRSIIESPNVNRLTQSDAVRVAQENLVDFETRLGTNPLATELASELSKIEMDFSGLDTLCLPVSKTPISIGSVCR